MLALRNTVRTRSALENPREKDRPAYGNGYLHCYWVGGVTGVDDYWSGMLSVKGGSGLDRRQRLEQHLGRRQNWWLSALRHPDNGWHASPPDRFWSTRLGREPHRWLAVGCPHAPAGFGVANKFVGRVRAGGAGSNDGDAAYSFIVMADVVVEN